MSRAYRISVRECLNRTIGRRTTSALSLELLGVLSPEEMARTAGRRNSKPGGSSVPARTSPANQGRCRRGRRCPRPHRDRDDRDVQGSRSGRRSATATPPDLEGPAAPGREGTSQERTAEGIWRPRPTRTRQNSVEGQRQTRKRNLATSRRTGTRAVNRVYPPEAAQAEGRPSSVRSRN